MTQTFHDFLDIKYGSNGDAVLKDRLAQGEVVHAVAAGETPLHVAARRRRLTAVKLLLDHGAAINAQNNHGKTAYAHAVRRGFDDIAAVLIGRGADTTLNAADQLAVAVVNGRLDEARAILSDNPTAARTGNPAEDRLLADVAGRPVTEPVDFLIGAGANLSAPGLDGGMPLHQAAWFGQPSNARLLIKGGAPLNNFDNVHRSSPLGWAIHGSRYSGGAAHRHELYADLVRLLLTAGSSVQYPDDPHGTAYLSRLREEASQAIRELLPQIP